MLLNSTTPSKPDQNHGERPHIHAGRMQFGSNPTGVILSGGSGMLGTALQSALAGRVSPILRLVRNAPTGDGQLQWNPAQSPAIAHPAPLEGSAAAIHLSGTSVAAHRWTAAYRRELAASRVDSTHALALALAALHRPPRALLVASAVGIYGNRADELLTEDSAPGNGFLANLCCRWEAAAQPAVDAGIRVVHLRFGVVLGPGHGALEKMLPPFRLGLGGKLGNGRQWMSWVSLADAVAGILFALETTSLSGPVNLSSPGPVTNADFTRALARQLGRPAFFAVPALALRLAFGEMANEALLASARVVPARLQSAGFQFAHPSIDEALAAALK
jgi:uncharacterized protein (TIGR01777 family)